MSKGQYHITKTGQARPCTAENGRCPYGGNDGSQNHYGTAQEARAAYEKSQDNGNALRGTSWSDIKKRFDEAPSGIPDPNEEPITLSELPTNRIGDFLSSKKDLVSQILNKTAEIDAIRDKKASATPQEVVKLNGEIRGKSIHLSTLKRKLNSQRLDRSDIDNLLKVNDAIEAVLEYDSADNYDAFLDATNNATKNGIDEDSVQMMAQDANMANMYFETNIRKTYGDIPEDHLEAQRYGYIDSALRSPEAVRQLREMYGRS